MKDWADFKPQTERDQLAYSLMVAGVAVDSPDGAGVLLDYGMADSVLADLHHRGFVVAEALAAPALRPLANPGPLGITVGPASE